MALLSTGTRVKQNHPLGKFSLQVDELKLDYDTPLEFFQGVCVESGDAESVEGLDLLSRVQSVSLASGSSVTSPLSDSSSDSGVLDSATSSEELFLAGLFGSDFSLHLDPPLESYSPTPSPIAEQAFFENSPQESEPDTSHHFVSKESKDSSGTASKPETLAERNRRNAEAARQNRIKKKKYVENLEKERTALRTDNVILKTKCHEYQTKCQRLQSEVDYLKSVLANESVLSSLIKNIPNIPSVKLTSSFRKRPNPCRQPEKAAKRVKKQLTGGVCLHVAKDVVSLEFCENCSKLASSSM